MYELFEQKYLECEKSLFLIAIGYLHNTEDANDCVQEAVLQAWKSFDTLMNKDFFKTWTTRIVINKCKDYIKKQRYTEELAIPEYKIVSDNGEEIINVKNTIEDYKKLNKECGIEFVKSSFMLYSFFILLIDVSESKGYNNCIRLYFLGE